MAGNEPVMPHDEWLVKLRLTSDDDIEQAMALLDLMAAPAIFMDYWCPLVCLLGGSSVILWLLAVPFFGLGLTALVIGLVAIPSLCGLLGWLVGAYFMRMQRRAVGRIAGHPNSQQIFAAATEAHPYR